MKEKTVETIKLEKEEMSLYAIHVKNAVAALVDVLVKFVVNLIAT